MLSSFKEYQILFWKATELLLDPLDLIFHALIGWDILDFVLSLGYVLYFSLGPYS